MLFALLQDTPTSLVDSQTAIAIGLLALLYAGAETLKAITGWFNKSSKGLTGDEKDNINRLIKESENAKVARDRFFLVVGSMKEQLDKIVISGGSNDRMITEINRELLYIRSVINEKDNDSQRKLLYLPNSTLRDIADTKQLLTDLILKEKLEKKAKNL